MQDRPVIALLPDGKRLRMRHGPIDLIVETEGDAEEVTRAYGQAARAFATVLPDLAAELPLLRLPVAEQPEPAGEIARGMTEVANRIAARHFATPMIAVAGAVADHVLGKMLAGRTLARAYVNNGGDIALDLSPGKHFDIGICADTETGEIASTARIRARDGVRGVATSGWRGRSYSLGIADAVTVLADSAAGADAAATLIANECDLPGHGAIKRVPARSLSPDSDLGDRLVTTNVGHLDATDVEAALSRCRSLAQAMVADGRVVASFVSLRGQALTVGGASHSEKEPSCLMS